MTDYRNYILTPADILREGSIAAILSAAVAYTFYKSAVVLLILLPVSYLVYPKLRRNALRQQRLWKLTLQFKEGIWILSGFLSVGMSVENAFVTTVPELRKLYGADSMIVREFEAIVRGIRLNKTIESMLDNFAERSGIEDIRSFAEVFVIAKRNGGSLKDIIERTGRIIRDKTAVTEEIKNMTAAKRYEQKIMNILPFGIIIYINMTSNGFLNVMYENLTGRLIMTFCLILTAVSYFLSQKILDIKI